MSIEIPGTLPGTTPLKREEPKPASAVGKDIWVKWGDRLFKVNSANQIAAIDGMVHVVYDGDNVLTLDIDKHPHIQELIESDPDLPGKTAAYVVGMLQDCLHQGGAGSVSLWHLVGTLQKDEPVARELIDSAPDTISKEEAEKLGITQ